MFLAVYFYLNIVALSNLCAYLKPWVASVQSSLLCSYVCQICSIICTCWFSCYIFLLYVMKKKNYNLLLADVAKILCTVLPQMSEHINKYCFAFRRGLTLMCFLDFLYWTTHHQALPISDQIQLVLVFAGLHRSYYIWDQNNI